MTTQTQTNGPTRPQHEIRLHDRPPATATAAAPPLEWTPALVDIACHAIERHAGHVLRSKWGGKRLEVLLKLSSCPPVVDFGALLAELVASGIPQGLELATEVERNRPAAEGLERLARMVAEAGAAAEREGKATKVKGHPNATPARAPRQVWRDKATGDEYMLTEHVGNGQWQAIRERTRGGASLAPVWFERAEHVRTRPAPPARAPGQVWRSINAGEEHVLIKPDKRGEFDVWVSDRGVLFSAWFECFAELVRGPDAPAAAAPVREWWLIKADADLPYLTAPDPNAAKWGQRDQAHPFTTHEKARTRLDKFGDDVREAWKIRIVHVTARGKPR